MKSKYLMLLEYGCGSQMRYLTWNSNGRTRKKKKRLNTMVEEYDVLTCFSLLQLLDCVFLCLRICVSL